MEPFLVCFLSNFSSWHDQSSFLTLFTSKQLLRKRRSKSVKTILIFSTKLVYIDLKLEYSQGRRHLHTPVRTCLTEKVEGNKWNNIKCTTQVNNQRKGGNIVRRQQAGGYKLCELVAVSELGLNRTFPSSLKPMFQSEANYEVTDIKITFYFLPNKTHCNKKSFAPSPVLKTTYFRTRK